MKEIRTRIAPSPTGMMHLGTARTAIYCWAVARHFGGKFLLRIEDTDQVRSTKEAVQVILDGMKWLNLDYDEGPVYQMDRLERYREVVDQMLADGRAYYCYATPEELDELREAQRAAAKKLASSETETVLLENREGLTLVGHLRECEKAERLVIAFHGWRSAWYRDFGLLADFLSREQCSVLYVEQRAQNESEGDYIGFGLTERYDCVDWANWAAERFPGLPVYLMGVSLGGATVLMAAGDILPAAVHGVIAASAYTSPRAIWQHVMGKNLHLPVRAATVIADSLCKKRLNASSGSYSTVEALKNTDVPILLIHGEDDHFVQIGKRV